MAGNALQSLLFVPPEGLGDVVVGADGYQGLAERANRGRPLQPPSPVLGFLPVPLWTSFPCGKTNTQYSVWSSSSIRARPLPKGVAPTHWLSPRTFRSKMASG